MKAGGRKNSDSRLLANLAAGMPIVEAAKQAGVSESTAYRRLEERRFRNQLERLKDRIVSTAVTRLSNASTSAVDTLVKLLDANSETARLGAARTILELGTSLKESVELAARITELERRQNENDKAINAGPGGSPGTSGQPTAGTGSVAG